MSQRNPGQVICCDGHHCANEAHAPIGLRPGIERSRAVDGWLFVRKGETWTHFCPACARTLLGLPTAYPERPGLAVEEAQSV